VAQSVTGGQIQGQGPPGIPEIIVNPEEGCILSMKEGREVGYKALTAVVMKSSVFWDITPCSPVKVNIFFGRKYRLHLQYRRVN
jgi:hypothetical protein